MKWREFNAEMLRAIEVGDEPDQVWLFAPSICSKPLIGRYEWQQGRNPHGFNTEGAGRIKTTHISHVMPFIVPEPPVQHQCNTPNTGIL